MEEITKVEQVDAIQLMEATQRAEIDMQISTAKAYPRNLLRTVDNACAIVTMDKETAQSCGYALPRGGKSISGPSVHLARIIAAEYGNLRLEAKVINITEKQIVSQAVCFDLEKNYAVKIEVRKSIIGKRGRFNDDMITVTGNAANAIAYRNAVFAVIPKSVVDKVYNASRDKITGDLSDEIKLIAKRKQVMDGFKDSLGVSEKEVVKVLGLNTIHQIKKDEIIQLIDLAQAIKDGDTTVEEAFGRTDDDKVKEKKKALREKKVPEDTTKMTPEEVLNAQLEKESQTKINLP